MKISSTTSVKTTRVSEPREPSDRPYSPYNLYYILEHRLLLQEKGVVLDKESSQDGDNDLFLGDMNSYCSVKVPPLPTRYRSLVLPKNWFVHGKKKQKRREHRKAHRVISFTELSRVVAARWKSIDKETFQYVKRVSFLIHKKWEENRLIRIVAKSSHMPHSSKGGEHQTEKESYEVVEKSSQFHEGNQEKKILTDNHSSLSIAAACSLSSQKSQWDGDPTRRLTSEHELLTLSPSSRCARYGVMTKVGAIQPIKSYLHPHCTTSAYFTAHRPVEHYQRSHSLIFLQRELANMHDLAIIHAEKLRRQHLQLRALVQSEKHYTNCNSCAMIDAPWTHQEELLLITLLREYPNQFALIMSQFPQRNKSSVIERIATLYDARK